MVNSPGQGLGSSKTHTHTPLSPSLARSGCELELSGPDIQCLVSSLNVAEPGPYLVQAFTFLSLFPHQCKEDTVPPLSFLCLSDAVGQPGATHGPR